jgi:hypothetical protein
MVSPTLDGAGATTVCSRVVGGDDQIGPSTVERDATIIDVNVTYFLRNRMIFLLLFKKGHFLRLRTSHFDGDKGKKGIRTYNGTGNTAENL